MLTQASPPRGNSGPPSGHAEITELGRKALTEEVVMEQEQSAGEGERVHIRTVAFTTPEAFAALDDVCNALDRVGYDVGFEPAHLETSAKPVYGIAVWARRRAS